MFGFELRRQKMLIHLKQQKVKQFTDRNMPVCEGCAGKHKRKLRIQPFCMHTSIALFSLVCYADKL